MASKTVLTLHSFWSYFSHCCEKTRKVLRDFVMSQFSYSPLIWIFHDRSVNAKINERAVRTSSFEELLITDYAGAIHQGNLLLLVAKIYRTRINLYPCFINEIFAEREIRYNLRVRRNIYV